MSERRTVREVLHYGEQAYTNCGAPKTAREVVDWLSKMLDDVPEEHRDAVEFEIDKEYDGDGDYPSLTVSYWRPETAEEMAARMAEAACRAAALARQREREERAELSRLKAKYGE